jgi:hypothetical protein
MLPANHLNFETWREKFFDDARRHGVQENAAFLEDDVLQLFWTHGTEPSVRGVIHDGKTGFQNGSHSKDGTSQARN